MYEKIEVLLGPVFSRIINFVSTRIIIVLFPSFRKVPHRTFSKEATKWYEQDDREPIVLVINAGYKFSSLPSLIHLSFLLYINGDMQSEQSLLCLWRCHCCECRLLIFIFVDCWNVALKLLTHHSQYCDSLFGRVCRLLRGHRIFVLHFCVPLFVPLVLFQFLQYLLCCIRYTLF